MNCWYPKLPSCPSSREKTGKKQRFPVFSPIRAQGTVLPEPKTNKKTLVGAMSRRLSHYQVSYLVLTPVRQACLKEAGYSFCKERVSSKNR
ncbi:MAG TPA: hypothetical protein EYN05_09730 [Nitrospinaceae bacterium]|nr:hypothetical protein [Nitrospinaceae bacterium]